MRNKTPITKRPWYPYAVAACIAVTLFVVLMNFGVVWKAIRTFFGYFGTVILAFIIAYLVNPLARFYTRKVFGKVEKVKLRRMLGGTLAFLTVILFLAFVLGIVIPQLIDSVALFASNLDGYVASLETMLERWGVAGKGFSINDFIDTSEGALNALLGMVSDNIGSIMSAAGTVGKTTVQWIIALLMSMYILGDKDRLKAGAMHLIRNLLPPERFDGAMTVLRRCDSIVHRYVVFNLLDSIIVGVANAIFMLILGMPYAGLVSILVALANLVPTFGPIVGGVIGAFILFLVKPWYALAFLIFTVVLQGLDAYVIKPRLFGDSLGISGLLILVGIIVGGNMFGMVGILLGVPAIAILDFLNRDYFLPWLEKKGPRARAEKAAAREAERAAAKAAKGAKGKAAAEKPAEKPEEKPAEQGD